MVDACLDKFLFSSFLYDKLEDDEDKKRLPKQSTD